MTGYLSPRERLVETAAALFYRCGIPNVGINEVTERAGVARMTLYNHFASKEDLVLAALDLQSRRRREVVDALLSGSGSADRRLQGLFDVAAALAADPESRGCAVINACLQLPDPKGAIHAAVRAHKDWIRLRVEDVLRVDGVKAAGGLAQQILALWDGAIIEGYIQQSDQPVKAARRAALLLLRAAREASS
jgi:AcrR family transcriptional regulator